MSTERTLIQVYNRTNQYDCDTAAIWLDGDEYIVYADGNDDRANGEAFQSVAAARNRIAEVWDIKKLRPEMRA